ncbi:MAG: hypothetical protein QF368_11150, partial [SAR202 cluster bacterium]|nr:hypothetical protein [SAR202 cluster bacterium]
MKLDAEIDLKLIESKLEHVIPKANVGPLKMLGDGFNSVVSETTDGRVIKVFKHEQPADRWQAVSELIDEIRPCVSTRLPTVGLSVE